MLPMRTITTRISHTLLRRRILAWSSTSRTQHGRRVGELATATGVAGVLVGAALVVAATTVADAEENRNGATMLAMLAMPSQVVECAAGTASSSSNKSITSPLPTVSFPLFAIAPSRLDDPVCDSQRLVSMGVVPLTVASSSSPKQAAVGLYIAHDAHGLEQTIRIVLPQPLYTEQLATSLIALLSPLVESRTGAHFEDITSCTQFADTLRSLHDPSATSSSLSAQSCLSFDLRGDVLVVAFRPGSATGAASTEMIATRIQSRLLCNVLLAGLAKFCSSRVPMSL